MVPEAQNEPNRFGSIRFDSIRFDSVRLDLVTLRGGAGFCSSTAGPKAPAVWRSMQKRPGSMENIRFGLEMVGN